MLKKQAGGEGEQGGHFTVNKRGCLCRDDKIRGGKKSQLVSADIPDTAPKHGLLRTENRLKGVRHQSLGYIKTHTSAEV